METKYVECECCGVTYNYEEEPQEIKETCMHMCIDCYESKEVEIEDRTGTVLK